MPGSSHRMSHCIVNCSRQKRPLTRPRVTSLIWHKIDNRLGCNGYLVPKPMVQPNDGRFSELSESSSNHLPLSGLLGVINVDEKLIQ